MSDICYCWHPKVGFYYYCAQHKPNKPASELREVLLVDMLGVSHCAKCGVLLKPAQVDQIVSIEENNAVDYNDDGSDIIQLKTPEQDARIGKRAIADDGFIGIIESIIRHPNGWECIQLENKGIGKGGCSPETVTILEDVQADNPHVPGIMFVEYGEGE